MDMRKGIIVAVSLLSALLAGCQQPSRTSKKQSAAATKTVNKHSAIKSNHSAKKQSSKKAVSELWDEQKQQQLATFMTSWGTTMKQDYDSYRPGHNTDFYGLKYPAELTKGNLVANDEDASFEWSKTGKGHADYEVVGIYSDVAHADSVSAHLYFFTIHQGQPVVLITEQNQGNSENKVYFKTTANTDLSGGFSRIVKGKTSTSKSAATATTADSKSTASSQSDKQDGKPELYTIDPAMRGTWYAVDGDGKLSTMTFDAHTVTSKFAGESSQKSTWYLPDGSDPDDPDNIHSDWGKVTPDVFSRYGVSLTNVRGWNQSAGDGSYYAVKQFTINGKKTKTLLLCGGAGAWVSAVYYPSQSMAELQKDKHLAGLDYGE